MIHTGLKKARYVIRTTEGLLVGQWPTYEMAEMWAERLHFEVQGIHAVLPLRADMLGPKVSNTVAAEPVFKSVRAAP